MAAYLRLVYGIDADQAAFEIGVKNKAVPGPAAWVLDPFSFERIHVHVVKFFNLLLETPDIEVVEAALPEAAQRIVAAGERETRLPCEAALPAAQAARDALLQDLNHSGRSSLCRFADEKMNVFGRNDVAHERKTVAISGFSENLNKRISRANRAQQRQPPIASESNEVKMPVPVMSNEFASHGERKVNPPTLQKRED